MTLQIPKVELNRAGMKQKDNAKQLEVSTTTVFKTLQNSELKLKNCAWPCK